MNRTGSISLYFFVAASIIGGCTAPKTPNSVDAPDEVHPTSQPVYTATSIRQATPTTVTTTLPVMNDPLDQKPEFNQPQEIPTTTSVQNDLHAEPTLDLEEPVTFDSEELPEITYTAKLPPAGFRGVLYAYMNYPNSEPTIDFQFLDAETNAVSNTEVTGSHAIDCWTYFSSDRGEWNLLYDNFDPVSDVLHYARIPGHWAEVPIPLPVNRQEFDTFIRQYFQSRTQFVSGKLSFVLTHYQNGISLNINGIVREYHVQHLNYLNYLLRDEDAIPSKSEPDTNLVPGTLRGWSASLHGTDGELFAISIQSNEPICGRRFVYFVSMVTGDIIHCSWTNAKFLLVTPPDQTTIADEIRLPPSGWFSNEPCTNDETDLAELAAVLEIRGRQLDS